jgi:transposase
MSTTDTAPQVSRYVALDVHRTYLMVGAVDHHQQVVLTPRRFGLESLTTWAATH